ncbi:MAG: superoxide dismutase [Calditrichaeota bacterium]|nr:MAG: superoxide dismutase [Calditrichota bacterium]
MAFTQDALDYGFNDLAPNFEASILEIHYGKHHAGYIAKLNAALEGTEFADMDLEDLIKNLDKVPANIRGGVRKNAGQHYNHSLYWKSLSPNGGGNPTGALGDAITAEFGSFDAFKEQFSNAAATQFGSGWAWLSVKDGKLVVSSTSNEDTPLMDGASPILTLDVWEHAYYLQFQNRRPDFIATFWNVVNWENANALYAAAK